MVLSSTIPEPDTGETAWVAATNYTVGTKVYRATTHKIYECQEAGVDAKNPEDNPKKWLVVSCTNKWAMFHLDNNQQTIEETGNIVVVIKPGKRINSLGLLGLEATSVTVTVRVAGNIVYGPKSLNTRGRNTTSWSMYFFDEFTYRPATLLQDIPQFFDAEVTIEIDNQTRPVKCGGVVLGTGVYIGAVQYNAKSDSLNFSKIERDDYGNSKLVPRRTIPKTSQTLWVDKYQLNAVRKVRIDLNAVPALWSGLDDKYDDPYFESIRIFGIYKQFEIDLSQPDVAILTLELEEL